MGTLEVGLRSPGPETGPAGRTQALVTCFLSLGRLALVWLFLTLEGDDYDPLGSQQGTYVIWTTSVQIFS